MKKYPLYLIALGLVLTLAGTVSFAPYRTGASDDEQENEVEVIETEESESVKKAAEERFEAAKKRLEAEKKSVELTIEAAKKNMEVDRELYKSRLKKFKEGDDSERAALLEQMKMLTEQRQELQQQYVERMRELKKKTAEEMSELQQQRQTELAELRQRRQELARQVGAVTSEERSERLTHIEKLAPKVANRLSTAMARLSSITEKLSTKLEGMTESDEVVALRADLAALVDEQEAAALAVTTAQERLLAVADSDNPTTEATAATEATQTAVTKLTAWRNALTEIANQLQ